MVEEKKIKELIDEYLRRAYKSFKRGQGYYPDNILFKCPECGRNDLQFNQEETMLDCLWKNCFFQVKVPSEQELKNFFENQEKIYRSFQKL